VTITSAWEIVGNVALAGQRSAHLRLVLCELVLQDMSLMDIFPAATQTFDLTKLNGFAV
jgi:hypothetical protein